LGRNITIGALNDYVRSVYCFAEGSLILEVVPLADRFCISFELVRPLKRFIRSFLATLAETGLPFDVEGTLMKRLPGSCPASTEQRLSKQKYRADTIFFVNYWHT
jgi:hypothetical protein